MLQKDLCAVFFFFFEGEQGFDQALLELFATRAMRIHGRVVMWMAGNLIRNRKKKMQKNPGIREGYIFQTDLSQHADATLVGVERKL